MEAADQWVHVLLRRYGTMLSTMNPSMLTTEPPPMKDEYPVLALLPLTEDSIDDVFSSSRWRKELLKYFANLQKSNQYDFNDFFEEVHSTLFSDELQASLRWDLGYAHI